MHPTPQSSNNEGTFTVGNKDYGRRWIFSMDIRNKEIFQLGMGAKIASGFRSANVSPATLCPGLLILVPTMCHTHIHISRSRLNLKR